MFIIMYSTLTKDDFGVYLIFVYFYQEFVCCQRSWLFLVFCNYTRVWISSVFKYIFVEFYWIMGWRLVLSLYTLHCSLYPLNRVTFCSFSSTLIVIYELWSWVFCLFFIHKLWLNISHDQRIDHLTSVRRYLTLWILGGIALYHHKMQEAI